MTKVDTAIVQEKVKTGAELSADEKESVLMGDVPDPEVKAEEVEPPKKEEKPKKVTGEAGKPDQKAPDKDGKKEEAGKKSSEKASEPPKEVKKEGEEPAKVEEPKAEEWGEKAERELKKPEGEEDLTSFNPREKGLFYELRQQRRRAQKAEGEAREAEHKLVQERLAAKKAPVEDVSKIFEGKEDDDLLTVGETKKILESVNRQSSGDESLKRQIVQLRYENSLNKTQQKYNDAPQVIALADELLNGQDSYSKMAQEEVSAAFQKGGNFVQVLYNFVKGHPKYPEYEGRIKKTDGQTPDPAAKDPESEDKLARAKKIEENNLKSKTTGGTGGGDAPRADEYTEDELRNMTPAQWKKLPEKTRQRILQG